MYWYLWQIHKGSQFWKVWYDVISTQHLDKRWVCFHCPDLVSKAQLKEQNLGLHNWMRNFDMLDWSRSMKHFENFGCGTTCNTI